ncbi:hypothetical protein SAMN05660209_01068 [Geodermatophilus africanus]|uniref:Uncharacterized protein n=1 Tax=Geodermatophilus africanus TaxID=1137993 RepID=A0A1H3DP26_9ACTN|nr:hypothetical protein [Geodermatophilus africanus]SDX68131.1 hypothetical protein SAMN05660209_01068 [Geodermatophilus africanus]
MTLATNLPPDDVGATLRRSDGVRGRRYTEIFLIDADAASGQLIAAVYNTSGLNDPADTGDSSPQQLVDQLDVEALKDEYGVLGAFRNGPRLWTLDWMEGMAGAERDFHGLRARWVMWLDVPKEVGAQGSVPYTPMTGRRDTSFGINAGSPAFILDDADGHSWVMKSASLMVDPNQTYDGLSGLGDSLQPRPGWRFRTMVLGSNLVLTPDNGTARITQDELGNTYDRVGGPFSNYTP